mgnify:CR=1 FL=1
MISGKFFTALTETWNEGQKTPLKPQPSFVKRPGNVCKVVAGRKIAKGEVVTILKVTKNCYSDPYNNHADTRGMITLIYQADNYDIPSDDVYSDLNSSCLVQLKANSKVWTQAKNLELCAGDFSFSKEEEVNGETVSNWYVHNADGTVEDMKTWLANHPAGITPYKESNTKFVPDAENCTFKIDSKKIERETAKAYLYEGNWIAKSVVYTDKSGKKFCPEWVFANRY